MKLLKQSMIAAVVLAALATPGAAKTLAEEIWDQINQSMPYRPSPDPLKETRP